MYHTMSLIKTYSDGSQEYLCGLCGRNVVFKPGAKPPLEILDAGNQEIEHIGGNGITMNISVKSAEDMSELDSFKEWIEKHDRLLRDL
jgi:hypothetical protein